MPLLTSTGRAPPSSSLRGQGAESAPLGRPLLSVRREFLSLVWDAAPDKHAAERAQKPASSRRNFSPWRAPMALPLLRAVDLQVHALALQVTPRVVNYHYWDINVLVAVPRHGWPGSWSKWRPGRELASGSNRE
jgi:hypothetical protein